MKTENEILELGNLLYINMVTVNQVPKKKKKKLGGWGVEFETLEKLFSLRVRP